MSNSKFNNKKVKSGFFQSGKKKLLTFLILHSVSFISFAQWTQTSYPEFSPTCIINNGTTLYAGDTIGKVFLSNDNGTSWNDVSIGLPNPNWITCLAISDTILFAGTKDSGMYKSTDDGLSWNQVAGGLPTVGGIHSITVNGATIYAVNDLHFYFSTNGGTNWTTAPGSFWGTPTAIITNGTNVLLSTYYGAGGAIFISSNNGTSWNFVSGDDYYSLASSDSVVIAGARGSSYGVHRSVDNGFNWSYYNPNFPNNFNLHTLAVAINGAFMFAGTDGTGIYYSLDLGNNWTLDNTGITDPNLFVLSLNTMDTTIFAGMHGGLWKRTISEFQPMASVTMANVDCNGNSTGSITVTPVGGSAPFQYSNDGGSNYQSGNVFTGLAMGTYSIVIQDANNHFSDTVSATISEPTTLVTLSSTITNADCSINNGSILANVSGGTAPYTYSWSNSASSDTNPNVAAGNFSYTVTDAHGCYAISPTITVGTNPIANTPICMVTVDSLSTHNIVLWEKTGLPTSIDSFRIYRETMTNVYTYIGAVSNDSLSEYHDYASNPNSTSFKYKLRAADVCGDTTYGFSDFHNTIHLQYLGLGNLLWSLYDIETIGNPVNFYIIQRDDFNTGNFSPISSTIPGTNNSFTDVNYASFLNARYRVDGAWGISCNPSRLIYTTHSNIIHPGASVSVSHIEQSNGVSISPNPFTSQTTITFETEQKNTIIKITDVLGRLVYQSEIRNPKSKISVDLSEAAKGIYFVQITNDNKNICNKKIIIQ